MDNYNENLNETDLDDFDQYDLNNTGTDQIVESTLEYEYYSVNSESLYSDTICLNYICIMLTLYIIGWTVLQIFSPITKRDRRSKTV